jgi:hypothetical protein
MPASTTMHGAHRVRRLRDADAGQRQPARALRRGAGARRLRQARRRGQDPGRPLRAREPHPLPGHLPGHAGGHHRGSAPLGRPGRRQQHRVRPRHAAPGDRADRRVAGPRRHDPEARRASPTSAARCAWARRAPTSRPRAPWPTASTATWSPSATATATRPTCNYLDRLQQAGLVISGHYPAREAHRDRRAAAGQRAPLVRRRAVPPRVQVHAVGRPPAVQSLRQGRAGPPGPHATLVP